MKRSDVRRLDTMMAAKLNQKQDGCSLAGPAWVVALLLLLGMPMNSGAGDAFLSLGTGRLLAGSGTDLTTAVASGPEGSAYFAGTFQSIISGSSNSITNAGASDIFVTRVLPDGTTSWLKGLGGTAADKAECITTDPGTGKVYLGGHFAGTAAFSGTNLTASAGNDAFIACFEEDGDLLWVRQISGSGDESVFDIKVASDGLHLCGRYNQNGSWGSLTFAPTGGSESMFVIRADVNGIPQAGVYVNSTQSIQPRRMVVLADGTRVVAGQYSGTAFFPGNLRASNGQYDFFTAAFDISGELRWTITGGGERFDEAVDLIPLTSGGLLLGASVESSTNNLAQVTDVNGAQALPLTANGLRVAKVSESGAYSPFLSLDGPQLAGIVEGRRGVLHLAGNFTASFTVQSTTVTPPGGQASIFLASFTDSGTLAGVSMISSSGYTGLLDLAGTSDDGLALGGLATISLSFDGQSLGSSHSNLNAFAILLTPPEARLAVSRQEGQVRLTYPSYYYDAGIWESITLMSDSWTQVSTPSTLTLGEMIQDFDVTGSRRFFQLRFSAP